jgi:hypothetical protein
MSGWEYKKLPFVYAAGNDQQLLVWSSLVASDSQLAPVKQYIEDHQLVLMEDEVLPSDQILYGKVRKSWFVIADARNLLMRFPADEESEA